jgi:3-hydroxyacyl-[acyl-carrier-protein] dehydratase
MRWLFIDRVEECEPGKRIVCCKSFSRSDLVFMDHFPGREIVPGVLEIEMIIQAAGVCVRLLRPKIYVVLSNIQSARFLKPISPGDQCRITATILKMQPHRVHVTGYIEVAGIRVGEAELDAAIVPGAEFDTRDTLVEDWIRQQAGRCGQDDLETDDAALAR